MFGEARGLTVMTEGLAPRAWRGTRRGGRCGGEDQRGHSWRLELSLALGGVGGGATRTKGWEVRKCGPMSGGEVCMSQARLRENGHPLRFC
jgi:hypothetical protein